MCGRFAQIEPISNIIKAFFIDDVAAEILPGYNIAPGSKVLSVVKNEHKRALVDFQWGLVPHWAKDPSIGQKMINARSETVGQKPSFRSAFKSRRCLIVASGFYEWKKDGRIKIPFYVKLSSGKPFAFAGLYETWESPAGMELRTCTIITTEANDIMKPIHNRMPVILSHDLEDRWLDISIQAEEAQALLAPYPTEEMEAYPVSTMVNSPKNNTAECIAPAR
jgi:putative SOS response-associated peptidase YedK